jgi:hypothetical protein
MRTTDYINNYSAQIQELSNRIQNDFLQGLINENKSVLNEDGTLRADLPSIDFGVSILIDNIDRELSDIVMRGRMSERVKNYIIEKL